MDKGCSVSESLIFSGMTILETLVLVPDSLPVIRINTKLLVYKKVLTRLDENVDV